MSKRLTADVIDALESRVQYAEEDPDAYQGGLHISTQGVRSLIASARALAEAEKRIAELTCSLAYYEATNSVGKKL